MHGLIGNSSSELKQDTVERPSLLLGVTRCSVARREKVFFSYNKNVFPNEIDEKIFRTNYPVSI